MNFHFSSSYFHLLLLVLLFRLCLSNNTNNFHDDILCKDDERQALVDFKHALIDEAGRLDSWVAEKKDCCSWTGIVCDNITGHVHTIHLPRNSIHLPRICQMKQDLFELKEECAMQVLSGNLSPSLLYLKQLRHLDLSGNYFGGIQVPSFIGSLGNLRYLNLSGCEFGGTIPPQLGNLTKLHTLCLGSFSDDSFYSFELKSTRNMQWLSNLRLLHHLDMSGVDFSNAINWLHAINTLPSLVELHLSRSRLPNIHPHVASLNLTSLSLLDLSHNHFTNSSMPRWIFSLTSLVSLDLSECDLHCPIPSSIDGFHNLTSLELLHVSGNDFMNSSLVLERLSSSIGGNLISLDISSCGVSSSVLESLHNLTSLLSLDLLDNQLTKTVPKSLGNLCNLRHIDLSINYFPNITLTILLESLFECKSPSLKSLSIMFSVFSGHLPYQLVQLTHLVYLQLGGNRIAGSIPDWIGQLSFLRSLQLYNNLISGPIPSSIGGLSSLEDLDLSNNQLNGTLPDSLGQLSMLIELDVSSNLLTGVVTKAHFSKLTRLKQLRGSGNNLILRPCQENWIPSFQLDVLYISSWDIGPQFPLWLQQQRDLGALDISNTKISSTLPKHFWRSFPFLVYLDMSQNQIQGRLFGIPALLVSVDLSSNKFGGKLPQLPCSSIASMLDLSNNSFVGPLRHLLCPNNENKLLDVLNLANNHLSGSIPEFWMKWPSLVSLNLENNNLSGGIPKTLGSLSSLGSLNMCNNKLSGRLPVSIKNLTDLKILQLAGNELVGRIPEWFGRKLPSLRILNLRSNHFDGNISHELCHLTTIQILDLAHNNLSGNIPRCFNKFSVLSNKETTTDARLFFYRFDDMESVGSASLVIKGREDIYSSILGLVRILDLSGNKFSGSIPNELMSLRALQSVNLSSNQLTGRIPENVGDLKSLVSFDVSLNRLSGELPVSLSSLSFLSSFNVSYNNLTGRVLSSTQFQTFNESSFVGNKLCGYPLTQSCSVEAPDHREEEDDDGSDGADWGLIISIVSGFIVGFWAMLAPLIVSTTWRISYFNFLSDMRFMFYDAIHKYCFNIFRK